MRSPRRTPLRSSVLASAVIVVALGGLAACGGDDAGSSAVAAVTAPTSAATLLTPEQGAALIAERGDELTVIDVRTPEEYAAGHLEGAVLIDVQDPSFDDRVAELPADGAYVVYCRSGNRSAQAASRLVDAGFTEVYDLGGIVEWQAAGYPVVTD